MGKNWKSHGKPSSSYIKRLEIQLKTIRSLWEKFGNLMANYQIPTERGWKHKDKPSGSYMLTCRGHPGNHLHMRASVSGFAGFPSEIFTCSRSSNPRFGGSMKQHMNLHLRVPKHIHRPLDLHNYRITILPIP